MPISAHSSQHRLIPIPHPSCYNTESRLLRKHTKAQRKKTIKLNIILGAENKRQKNEKILKSTSFCTGKVANTISSENYKRPKQLVTFETVQKQYCCVPFLVFTLKNTYFKQNDFNNELYNTIITNL